MSMRWVASHRVTVYYVVRWALFGRIAVAIVCIRGGGASGVEPSDDRAARCRTHAAALAILGSTSMQPNVFVRDQARTHAYDDLFTSIRSVSKHD
ncbi:hypothetical protein DIE23_01310 [Burkholderia sp. Bp9143]|nr:hypothetical protein DIE23_01310 [Burkholderia sp. Bp9143]